MQNTCSSEFAEEAIWLQTFWHNYTLGCFCNHKINSKNLNQLLLIKGLQNKSTLYRNGKHYEFWSLLTFQGVWGWDTGFLWVRRRPGSPWDRPKNGALEWSPPCLGSSDYTARSTTGSTLERTACQLRKGIINVLCIQFKYLEVFYSLAFLKNKNWLHCLVLSL